MENRTYLVTEAEKLTGEKAHGFYLKILIFPKSRADENTRKMPLLRNRGAERRVYENRAYEAGKDHRYLV